MHDLWTDLLSGYLDEDLPREQAQSLEAHLAGCAECRAVLDDLRQVRVRAGALVDPPVPDDLWAGIATRIGAAGSTSDAPRAARMFEMPRWHRRALTFSLPQLAAAAFLLVCGSAFVVWTLRGQIERRDLAAGAGAPRESVEAGGAALAAFDAARVDGEIAALQQALDRGRDRLDPQTVLVLEKNLELIRKATVEARQALAADPANAALRDYLAGTVGRKLELMKRATEMAGI